MRKIIVITLGLASLGALASALPAFATGTKCVPVNCHTYRGTAGPVTTCDKSCVQTTTSRGPGAPQTIQQQKNKRMN
jgi:hypothetical protein